PESEAPDSISTQVNAYNFSITSEEGKFPSTGFKGATFTLELKNGASASNYQWTSDASWINVNGGVVKFMDVGTGDKVTITGRPTSAEGKIIRYSFTLRGWFINNGSTLMKFNEANAYCAGKGYVMPSVAQLNGNTTINPGSQTNGVRGGIGGLWSEWGDLNRYTGADFPVSTSFPRYSTFTTDRTNNANFVKSVYLPTGVTSSIATSTTQSPNGNAGFVVCRKDL
ncbi:hypothetical protein ACR9HI_09590, partial [Enterobacter ludwigii]